MVLGPILENHLYAEECTSTNDELWKLYDSTRDTAKIPGLFFTTGFQSAGRGQGSNTWHSSPGSNILMSFIAQPKNLHPAGQFNILRFTSLGIAEFLRTILPSKYRVEIKWPNDILAGGQKICGMLIEHRIMGNTILASVTGIGLNVNEMSFPGDIRNATSLRLLFSTSVDRDEILEKLLEHLREFNMDTLKNSLNLLHKRYDEQLFGSGRKMLFRASGETFSGIINGTDRTGLLKVIVNGRERCFGFKDISYLF